ncbi:MAG: hypothetical protein A3F41_01865 [Coxiella sp. RIFCSPHIGHO2_12_FULL_44_14]|nr:MAG: hypothetical protein A3F41_01865 [Coxiella sp. RIFCSPHIGHO2_12_FULL_44_14]
MTQAISDLHAIWNNDGYVLLPGFFDLPSVSLLSNYLDEISRWEISEDKWMMWFEKTTKNELIVSRVENFIDYHEALKNVIFSDNRIVTIITDLFHENPVLFKDRIIFKFPDSGGYQPHQDAYCKIYRLPQREVFTVVTLFVDDATEANGCMYVAPGKHKLGILKSDDRGVMYEEDYKNYTWKPIICKAGDVLLFDNYLPHYSNMNKSNKPRRAIYFPYQKESSVSLARTQYYVKKREIAPPEKPHKDINNLYKQNEIFYRE